MSSNLFNPSLRYTNKDTCNSAWTFIDGQNVSDIEVPKFIKNLFTSFDDSRYGKMGKDLIEGATGDAGESCIENHGGEPTCNRNLSCMTTDGTSPCNTGGADCHCVATDSGRDEQPVVSGKCSGNAGGTGDFTCPDGYTAKASPETIDSASTDDEATRRAACCDPPERNTCATAYGDPTATGVNHRCNVYGMGNDGYSPEDITNNPQWYGPIDSPEKKDILDTSLPGITSTNFDTCCTKSSWPTYCAIDNWDNSDVASWITGMGCPLFR